MFRVLYKHAWYEQTPDKCVENDEDGHNMIILIDDTNTIHLQPLQIIELCCDWFNLVEICNVYPKSHQDKSKINMFAVYLAYYSSNPKSIIVFFLVRFSVFTADKLTITDKLPHMSWAWEWLKPFYWASRSPNFSCSWIWAQSIHDCSIWEKQLRDASSKIEKMKTAREEENRLCH